MKSMHTNSDFTFAMTLAKAFGEEDDQGQPTRMVIKGVASNTRRDKENHQVTLQGLQSIKKAIEDGYVDEDGEWDFVPLRSGHRSEWEDKLGNITKAEIDDNENLWITAELDPTLSKARDLYIKVSKGNANGRKPQLGLSVKGKATKYHFGYDATTDTQITYLDNLTIEEVSVTAKPKNPTPYPLAIAKSLLSDPEYTQALAEYTAAPRETEEPMTHLSQNASVSDDPITKAIEKAHEASNEPTVATDNSATDAQNPTEQSGAASPQTSTDGTEAQPTTAEADALQAGMGDGADKIQRDVPEGYAAHPAQTQENAQPANQEAVATPEQGGNSELVSLVRELMNKVEALEKNQTSVEAQKAETVVETPAESVTLAQPENLDERIAVAVTKAFESFGLNKVADEIAVVKSAIDAMQSQPNDKSISVSKAKDGEDMNDPIVRMQKLRERGYDPIRAAAKAAYNEE